MVLFFCLLHAGIFAILASNLWYLRRQPRATSDAAPRVSVLIPARNEAANLRRLLPSLLQQDYPDVEVIVYDDGSEDETWAVLQSINDPRLRTLRDDGPPPGWVGKVHALFQATRAANGACYLFLDADTRLESPQALRRLVRRHTAMPTRSVMTGFARLRGGGLLLVSLVPHAILTALPWPLVSRTHAPSLSALNGQCWMIDADLYHRYEPHRALPAEVLEDVMIGRYLKGRGVTPVLADVRREVSVFMYDNFVEAWHGFRKNTYLIMGGRPGPALFFFVLYLCCFVLPPLASPWFFASLYAIKAVTDRLGGMPLWVTLLAPFTFVLSALLQLDSTLAHRTGRIAWKGRSLPSTPPSSVDVTG